MHETFDNHRPIYLQIIEAIKRRAVRGDFGPGDPLPSVREMARNMKVNPNTMARAYMELEREGFTLTQRGTGSFITKDATRIEDERERFIAMAVDRFLDEIGMLGLEEPQIEAILETLIAKIKDPTTQTREESCHD
ncbi:GntR family transcriptional regulator [Sulfidibacter corallicola]|uniref:GntR family transcriptional regulator n=1 Tax=Sulfidibacter corallicola TaxID=2818388 RepID=A0A8A4THW9_SULCO|nr:GntR family transcriptional regulator [Sulfidibacter corallicola]QTD48794.1 GntR family transcriptional regulator [Sulfidibacter corallicola]